MRTRIAATVGGLLIALGAVLPAQTGTFVAVTDATLQKPDPADWINWRRTQNAWGYSPLDQINRSNVNQLQLAWSWALPTGGRPEPNPLVYKGVMYVASPFGVVEALDAATGDLLWQYKYDIDRAKQRGIVTTRNLALYGENLYLTTPDAHVVALAARTGQVVWNVASADAALGFTYTAGPLPVAGRIVTAVNGCERYKKQPCFIVAHDAASGKEVWRTATIAAPGEPGGDTWCDTPLMFRAGGDSWTTGSFDPQTNLIYWATAQPKPWARFQRRCDADALYTNSVLALDPATGKIVWHKQLIPGDSHDMDETFENLLVDYDGRRSLFKVGKLGILWEIDRTNGRFRAAHDLGYQTILVVDPQTGAIRYREGMLPKEGVELEYCPSVAGFKSWRSMAYHPGTRAFYVPLNVSCERATYFATPAPVEGGGGVGSSRREHTAHPLRPDGIGEVAAIDVTGKVLWRHKTATPIDTAVLTTAGGLVIAGDWDRNLYVHDAASGKVLYTTRLPSSVIGYPITYAVRGRQYIAVPVGTDASMWSTITARLAPGRTRPASEGYSLFVFALPGTSAPATR